MTFMRAERDEFRADIVSAAQKWS
jgi:triphosphatase